MSARQPRPTQVGWSVKNWCADTDLSESYAYELIGAKVIDSVKIGGKRLITTPPREFIARIANVRAA